VLVQGFLVVATQRLEVEDHILDRAGERVGGFVLVVEVDDPLGPLQRHLWRFIKSG